MTQQEFIEQLKSADINQQDWLFNLLEKCNNLYARGYMTATAEGLGETFSADEEEFRDEIIACAKANIWNVKIDSI